MSSLFNNLGIGKRMMLGFAVILCCSLVAIAVGLLRLQAVADATRDLMEEPLATERMVSDWHRLIYASIRRNMAIVHSQDDSLAAFFAADLAESTRQAAELQKRIEPHMQTPRELALWKELMALRKEFLGSRDQALALKKESNYAQATAVANERFGPVAKTYGERLQELQDEERKQINVTAASIQDIYANSRRLLVLLSVLSVAFVLACASLLTRSIVRPLEQAVDLARRVAAGDLTTDIGAQPRDETGQLLTALGDMSAKLSALVAGVRHASEQMATASQEIAAGNADLSSRTEHQASALEETATSMEELTGTVRQNADNAQQANQLVVSASGVAESGGQAVSAVVNTMTGIADSSRRIADIIGVIDGIAFQTNILALNAAVEAARAGEQGRGFAVVASEVRNLAQRSASAAREIKALINDSVARVGQGSKLVDQAGQTMEGILHSVHRVADIMSEITAASREQSDGIEQVNRAIIQMDQMTQQNAALVEQAAAAAASMEEQAGALTRAVSVFRIAGAGPRIGNLKFGDVPGSVFALPDGYPIRDLVLDTSPAGQ